MQLTADALRTADALIILDADAMSPQGVDAVFDYGAYTRHVPALLARLDALTSP